MRSGWERRGGEGWRGRRGRPPWWPRNEPFPPAGGDWRRIRGRFMRRVALFAFMALVLFIVVISITVSALLQLLQLAGPRGQLLVIAVVLVGIVVVVLTARGVGRFAAPLGDLIGAAGRVEAGDLSTRVAERGPREVRSLARAFNAMSARLEGSEEERRRLLADVSHELRTPLAVVQGNVEAIIDGVHPADETHLGAILDETKVLSRLIEDLGTLSLAESGALALHREPTDLASLARATAASFAMGAAEAGVSLDTSAPEDLPPADVDPVRVRELLANLVQNALRYTPRGGRVRIEARRDGAGAVTLAVTDTGAGIAPDELARIFDRFYKSPESRGAGLGLAIAKKLVEAHGGTIVATSTVGEGTTVRFTLPLGAASG